MSGANWSCNRCGYVSPDFGVSGCPKCEQDQALVGRVFLDGVSDALGLPSMPTNALQQGYDAVQAIHRLRREPQGYKDAPGVGAALEYFNWREDLGVSEADGFRAATKAFHEAIAHKDGDAKKAQVCGNEDHNTWEERHRNLTRQYDDAAAYHNGFKEGCEFMRGNQ